MKKSAFTLIEMLIVIVIIGILAAALVPKIKWVQERAQMTRLSVDMKQITRAITFAQDISQKTLMAMSWQWWSSIGNCSRCACPSWSLRNIATSHQCYVNRVWVLNGISINASIDIKGITRDPRWSPYLMDENQWENGNCTTQDTFYSAGPDATRWGGDDVNEPVTLSSYC